MFLFLFIAMGLPTIDFLYHIDLFCNKLPALIHVLLHNGTEDHFKALLYTVNNGDFVVETFDFAHSSFINFL